MITLILFSAAFLVLMQLSCTLSTIALYEAAERVHDLPAPERIILNIKSKLHYS